MTAVIVLLALFQCLPIKHACTNIHVHIHVYTHKYTHPRTACRQTCSIAHTSTHTHECRRSPAGTVSMLPHQVCIYTYTCPGTHTHTSTHTSTHKHTHTHDCSHSPAGTVSMPSPSSMHVQI